MKTVLKFLWYALSVLFGLIGAVFAMGIVEKGMSGLGISVVLICAWLAWAFWRRARRIAKASAVGRAPERTPKKRTQEQELLVSLLYSEGPRAAWEALRKHGEEAGMDEEKLRRIVRESVPALADEALEDGILTVGEEAALMDLLKYAGIDQRDISAFQHERLLKAAIIRDLLEGEVHPRISFKNLPFNLMKKEVLIWTESVEGYEHKTRTEYVGSSQGVSIRIAKGVYWRTGSMKGRRVQREVQESIGCGILSITNIHLYFAAGNDVFRVRHDKIVSIVPTENSVVINRDGARSRPLEFVVPDPWFIANVLSNARNWA